MVRRRFWMRCARRMWLRAKPGESPSILAPIRSTSHRAEKSPSSIRRAMRRLPPCGHAALRSRMSFILVVAADDGVMPQTIEAIKHAKGLMHRSLSRSIRPTKPGANPDRVRQELLSHESWSNPWVAMFRMSKFQLSSVRGWIGFRRLSSSRLSCLS